MIYHTHRQKLKKRKQIKAIEGEELRILIPNKILIRRPVLLAQLKAGNNSYKL